MYPFSPRAVCRVFVCTALNRNSRIVGQVGSDNFLFCMQSFESALLPLPCEREIFDVSCYADPTRSRCKPRSRSLQIGFYDHRWRFALSCLPADACSCLLAWRFAWLIANFAFRVAHVGGLRGLRSKDSCPCSSTWAGRILPVCAPGFVSQGRVRVTKAAPQAGGIQLGRCPRGTKDLFY